MRILITIMILWSSTMAFGQEIWQLSPWAPDSSYVIGAMNSGEPTWVKVDSVKNKIYHIDQYPDKNLISNPNVYDIYADYDNVFYYDTSGNWSLFIYDNNQFNEGDLSLENVSPNVVGIRSSTNYTAIKKIEGHGLKVSYDESNKIDITLDTTLISTIISDSMATIVMVDSTIVQNSYGTIITETPANTFNITVDSTKFATQYDITQIPTEPDSIQRSGNIISLRDGSGSVDVSDLVNVADSTIVQNSYGTIITESPANNFNVKVDSSLFATTYDITQKQNVITGTSGQTLRFDGTNTLIANSLLYNVGNQIGIGTITPTASYILDVAGNTKVRDGFLTVDNTVFINAATTLNMYNSANTGIFHSYQDGATSTDNIVYKGQYKTFTIGYNAGAGQSYANVANKKLHVNGAVSIGDGVSSTSVAANSLLVQGSATIQDRTGTASTLGGFDANGKLVGVTYGSGLSLSGNQLSATGINGVENQIAWFNSTNTITSSSAIFRNANGLNTSENFDINTTGGFKGVRRIMSGLNHGVTNKLPTDMAWGFLDYSSTAYPNMYLVGVGKTSVPVMSFDLIRLDNPTSTYLNFELGYKNGVSTIAADPLSNLFRINTGGQTKFNIFGNGDIRSYGALYNSANSAGTTGQVLTSQGTGAWTWSTPVDQSTTNELQTISTSGAAGNITLSNGGGTLNLNINDADASTTNELQNLSLSGQSLGISSGTGVTLPIVDVVQGDGIIVNKASGVATIDAAGAQFAQLQAGSFDWVSQTMTSSFTKIDYGQTYFNGASANSTTDQITINATGDYEVTYCGCTILPSGTTTKINLQLYLNNSATGVFLGNSKHVLANECFSKSYMKYLTSGTTVDLRFAKDNGDSTSIYWDSHSLTVNRIR